MYNFSTREPVGKNENFHKSRKTTTITLRIDTDVMQNLYNKSRQDDISLNTLFNQVLKRYVEWDMYEGKAEIISPF